MNAFLRWLLRVRYRSLDLVALQPDEPFDIQKHQLIPGRALSSRNLDSISRHRGEIREISGREIALKNGERFETDRLLWGTGYRMNLEYLGLPEYCEVRTPKQLRPRLGSLIRSIDYPNLFFMGMILNDSTSATPFFAAIEARSLVAHISGECEIPKQNVRHLVAYWDLFRHYASFDHANYPRYWWRIKYLLLALWYAVLPWRDVRI